MIILFISSVDATVVSNDSNYTLAYKKDEQKIFDNYPTIGCKAAFVANPKTGKILYEKNAHEKMFPASTTKVLTALITLERCSLTDKVIISKNAISLVPDGYSDAKLQAGEEFTILELLYALLLPSANEAANALAEHISGSVEAFAELSNKRAKELGCEMVHFVNPNGIHDENHYCTAYDLYLIAKECQKYEVFNDIVKTQTYTMPATTIYTKNDRVLRNTNSLLIPSLKDYYYSYCTGIKTGFTTPAGQCFIGGSSHDGLDLISVVLGGGTNSQGLNERFYDTKQLFDFTYSNYSIKEIINRQISIANIEVNDATKETSSLDVLSETNISSIVPNVLDIDNIHKTITIAENISAPVEKGQTLGQITFHVDGLNYTTNLVASHSVERIPYWIYNCIIAVIAFILFLVLIKKLKKSKKYKKILLLLICTEIILLSVLAWYYYNRNKNKSGPIVKTYLNSSEILTNVVGENENIETADLQKCVEEYLVRIGMKNEDIIALKNNLM
jgi:D-alanyl-D-alanine carboxypeptidase (penicillin-binding protein 5/6)